MSRYDAEEQSLKEYPVPVAHSWDSTLLYIQREAFVRGYLRAEQKFQAHVDTLQELRRADAAKIAQLEARLNQPKKG